MQDMLKGKTLVALGDSLIHGNKLGNAVTWPNLLGEKCGMTVHNFGKNGNAIAKQEREPQQVPMCVRYADMPDGADYVVVLGGANDRRLRVPVGENNDTDITTFKGALNTLIAGLTEKYPKAKILFMTNYNRYPEVNELGLSDIDYVVAMQEVCRKWAIPCFDNYHESGISFQTPSHLAWIDEGVQLGIGPNRHFTKEAYEWLLPKYEALLRSL